MGMNPSKHGSSDFWKKNKTYGPGIFLLVSLLYLLTIALYFHPYFSNFTGALIGPPEDNMQDFWNTWYSQITLDKDPTAFFHTNIIKYPEGTPLYYHCFCLLKFADYLPSQKDIVSAGDYSCAGRVQ